ncbi:hypothetical protein LLE49_25225 [Alicyclobacillus tolerans]|uniref:hypothetical protein n=1 Tax=Alicyclobacillus tolerans TaxID=90970 RepID=UPI001F349AF0|nr:hypothetical protein [Alicyclobacillus tolerans]MCF8568031.1 hypothetical protein [Alicyclobacillus tolerans]
MDEKWYVVVVKTQNGLRIAMDMDPSDAVAGPMSEEKALEECNRCGKEHSIPQFDYNVDVWFGDV